MCVDLNLKAERTKEGISNAHLHPKHQNERRQRIEAAMHWDTRERAGHMVSSERGGITVKAPDGTERTAHISDFKIEERPQGGFAISCEDPFSIN